MVILEGQTGDTKSLSTEDSAKDEGKHPNQLTLESILYIQLASFSHLVQLV